MKTDSILVVVASLGCLILLGLGAVAQASELKVLSAVAMRAPLQDLASEFERTTSHRVSIAYATAGVVGDRIQSGELVDLAILPRPATDCAIPEHERAALQSLVEE